jgi:uroporphyrinogen decarboxylase
MLEIEVKPDYEALLANLRREGTPKRVHHLELLWDGEIAAALIERFRLADDLDTKDPDYWRWCTIRLHRFLGYDYLPVATDAGGLIPAGSRGVVQDTAPLAHAAGRAWIDERLGPIKTVQDFETYPWPDPTKVTTANLEWFDKHAPDDMCLRGGNLCIFTLAEFAMGYEGLCYAMYDQPDLVDAVFQRIGELNYAWCQAQLQSPRVKFLLATDDFAFKTATMVSADFLKEKALVWHKRMAELCHRQGRLYCLHACGNVVELMPHLIEEVKLDGRHSFEDVIEPITVAKKRWGDRLALLGGIDVDFLCRATPEQVRTRVRETLEVCLPGGGYCLGSGNSVANYVPVDNFLAMLDEGRRFLA